jgi:hypothetical protein
LRWSEVIAQGINPSIIRLASTRSVMPSTLVAPTRSLAKRPGLWSVLSALLIEPGRVMSPDEFARHAWGVGYHAVRHATMTPSPPRPVSDREEV